MSERAPCVRCGMILHTGEGRVMVSFTPDELEFLALASPDPNVADRLLCALGLLDADREQAARMERML
jgi:hypothetical protein